VISERFYLEEVISELKRKRGLINELNGRD
jgi:hypothetical protein